LRPLRIVERHGGLIGEQAHHVAVGVVEAAVAPVDVRVEIAEELFLGDRGARRYAKRCSWAGAVSGV
jgi:hypothetical protein